MRGLSILMSREYVQAECQAVGLGDNVVNAILRDEGTDEIRTERINNVMTKQRLYSYINYRGI